MFTAEDQLVILQIQNDSLQKQIDICKPKCECDQNKQAFEDHQREQQELQDKCTKTLLQNATELNEFLHKQFDFCVDWLHKQSINGAESDCNEEKCEICDEPMPKCPQKPAYQCSIFNSKSSGNAACTSR